jgi:hypothetical protein
MGQYGRNFFPTNFRVSGHNWRHFHFRSKMKERRRHSKWCHNSNSSLNKEFYNNFKWGESPKCVELMYLIKRNKKKRIGKFQFWKMTSLMSHESWVTFYDAVKIMFIKTEIFVGFSAILAFRRYRGPLFTTYALWKQKIN